MRHLRNEEWLLSNGYYDPYESEFIAVGKLLEDLCLREFNISIGFAGGSWEVVLTKNKSVRGKGINLLDALADAFRLATVEKRP